jgi:hypothetical protein
VALVVLAGGCRKTRDAVETMPAERSAAHARVVEGDSAVIEAPEASADHEPTPSIPEWAWSAGRWLEVITPDPKTPGGWATGSFDPAKNKLIIDTHDARQFLVRIDMIDIDWNRLVVLSLNGANSELRRREAGVLTFDLDDHGQWVILEPPTRQPE